MKEQIKEILEELGLTEKETMIYLAMLKLGEESASRISQIAGLNRITTYSLLKSLVNKGFCSLFDKNNIQYFKPATPEQIIGLIEERKEKLRIILPELKQEEKTIEEKPEVMIFEGKKGIVTLFEIVLKDAERKKEVFGYGNLYASERLMEYQSIHWRSSRIERKIKMRAIINELGDIPKNSPNRWKNLTEFRLDKSLSNINVYILITENYLAQITLLGDPIGILIKSKQIADKEKFIFENLWKKAKKES